MPENMIEDPKLTTRIVEAVKEHWDNTGRATLLSFLGKKLKDEGSWDGAAASFSLFDYISGFLPGKLRREARPGHETIFGLFPLDADLSGDLAAYFTPPPREAPSIFHPFIWEAFQTEIPPARTRVINLGRSLMQDREGPVTQLDANEFLVERTDQPLPAYRRDGKAMRDAIERWAGKVGIERDLLLVRAGGASPAAPAEVSAPAPRRTVLEVVLSTLDSRDQQRVTMPLDVVDKLRRHQI